METPERMVANSYRERFGEPDILVWSPGRINLIGEHTDYNGGFVMPAAIDTGICVAVSLRTDDAIRLYSTDFSESYDGNVTTIEKTRQSWANYVLGVIDILQKAGHACKGFDLVIGGNVPIGAGMSSSAAVECAVIYAMDQLHGFQLEKLDMVKMAQRSENEFIGMQCGIMDQFASMYGKEGHVIQLDCRSLEHHYFPFVQDEYALLLVNTRVKHSLADSQYNLRRQDCEQGVAIIRQHLPHVQLLRDVTRKEVDQYLKDGDAQVYKRCAYVVDEIARVEAASAALLRNDLHAFGKMMFETHEGLSRDYEVSCPELDFLVDFAAARPEVLGARMMGGGFGGCTINLLAAAQVNDFINAVSVAYHTTFQVQPEAYSVKISAGTSVRS